MIKLLASPHPPTSYEERKERGTIQSRARGGVAVERASGGEGGGGGGGVGGELRGSAYTFGKSIRPS
jgi:hypothetical protein